MLFRSIWSIGLGAQTIYVSVSTILDNAGRHYLSYNNVDTNNERILTNELYYRNKELMLGMSVKRTLYLRQGSEHYLPLQGLRDYSLVHVPEKVESTAKEDTFFSLILWVFRYIRKNHPMKMEDTVVLVVPDYLNETQRSIVLEAAQCAEFPHVHLCLEGLAIAFANQHYNQMMNPQDPVMAMYINMGATHSTVDFVRCANREMTLLYTASVSDVCGDEVTRLVWEMLTKKLRKMVAESDSLQEELEENEVDIEMVCSETSRFNNRKEINSLKSAFTSSNIDDALCEISCRDFSCQVLVTAEEFNTCCEKLQTSLESFLKTHIEQFQNEFHVAPTRVEVVGGNHRPLLFRNTIERVAAEELKECKRVSYTLGLEFNANGGILSEMTHSLPGVDADAIMRMKMAAPSELKVQFMRWKDGRFQRDEFVALRKHEEIGVPTENTFTILFEAADVVGSSIFVTEDGKTVCYFESENPLSREAMKLSLRFDSSLTLRCFLTAGGQEKELKKHSFFYRNEDLCPQFFSLQDCVKDVWSQLRERKEIAEKQLQDRGAAEKQNQTAEWMVKEMLETEATEPSLLVRALYNVMEQDRFETMRRQVGSKRNQVDVITTQARKKGVKLERISSTFESIRNRFINGKTTQEVVAATKEKLQALKKEVSDDADLCAFLDEIEKEVDSIGGDYPFIEGAKRIETMKKPLSM